MTVKFTPFMQRHGVILGWYSKSDMWCIVALVGKPPHEWWSVVETWTNSKSLLSYNISHSGSIMCRRPKTSKISLGLNREGHLRVMKMSRSQGTDYQMHIYAATLPRLPRLKKRVRVICVLGVLMVNRPLWNLNAHSADMTILSNECSFYVWKGNFMVFAGISSANASNNCDIRDKRNLTG